MRLKQLHILPSITYVSYECKYAAQMRHIFSTNEDVENEEGTSSSFEKDWHCSKMFLNELLLLLGYQLKILAAYDRLQNQLIKNVKENFSS